MNEKTVISRSDSIAALQGGRDTRAPSLPLLAMSAVLMLCACAYAQPTRPAARAANASTATVSLTGKWDGIFYRNHVRLRVVLTFTPTADGSYTALLDSPDQNVSGVPVDTVRCEDSLLYFAIEKFAVSFTGTVSRDGNEIAGRWNQLGPVPFVLTRVSSVRHNQPPTQAAKLTLRSAIKLQACALETLSRDALCGRYDVFEDREAKQGRRISLSLLILPATGAHAAGDPVFFLAGGPGQGARSIVAAGGDFLPLLHRDRDLVFMDQRGTGASNPLQCDLTNHTELGIKGHFVDPFPLDVLKRCRMQLEQTSDLRFYTTSLSVDDLEDVRKALGYDKINLYGGSYGTRVGLVYLRKYGMHVRAALLQGVAPPDAKLPLPFAKGVEQALNRLFSDCAADAKCNTAFPNLRAEFGEIIARLEHGAANFEIADPDSPGRVQVSMSKSVFMEAIRLQLYSPDTVSVLPLLLHLVYEGNFAPFAGVAYRFMKQIEEQIARGMHLSVTCAEDEPFIGAAEIATETRDTWYGDARVRAHMRACAEWPRGWAPDDFHQPIRSGVPVLMISGAADPVTPPALAANALKGLSNGRQIIVLNGTHLTESECLNGMVAEFFTRGTTKVNDTCVTSIRRLPFVTSSAR